MINCLQRSSHLIFFKEMKPTDGNVSTPEITPDDRRVLMVLLGFPVAYKQDVITSH